MSQEEKDKRKRLLGYLAILIVGAILFFAGIILADVAGAAVASAIGIG